MKERTKNLVICIVATGFLSLMFLASILVPDKEFSISERRKLALRPEIKMDRILNGKFMVDYDKYTLDQFPKRDLLRRLKAEVSMNLFKKKDNNDLYIYDNYISSMEYPMNEESLDRASNKFRFIYERFLKEENKVYLSVIPDKNRFTAEQSGHLSMDYEQFEMKMKEKNPYASYIKISDLLEREDYYRTDTHWRQEKIQDVADRLAIEMGTSIEEADEAVKVSDEFYGVYANQLALSMKPEEIHYVINDKMKKFQIMDKQNNKEIELYALDKATGLDPYEMFLSGPLSLVEITNPTADTDKELIIFRDSFGSSIAPLLAQGYEKTTLVDIRYLQSVYLDRFVDFENADVLFLYSTLVLNNSEMLK